MVDGDQERKQADSAGLDEGHNPTAGDLFALVYGELHRLAEGHLRGERNDHTLQATALVHEAYLRLNGKNALRFRDRAHLLGFAARAMRQILVEHARRRGRKKRGGNARKLSLDDLFVPSHDPNFDLLELDEALTSLATRDRRSAEVFQMRFFGGLTHSEISQVLGVTTRTVERDWRYARAWLVRGRPATP